MLVSEPPPPTQPNPQAQAQEEEFEDDVEYQSETVLTIMKPVSITMIFVAWAVRTITLPGQGQARYIFCYFSLNVFKSAYMAYEESDSDSTGVRLFHSIINALIFLAAILGTTVLFVILYKYRCLKVIYTWLITSSFIIVAAFGGYFF